jgi:DNA topoisomerase VI subunit B
LVRVAVSPAGFAVSDNGPGLPAAVVEGSLNYDRRVSDKALYVTPTRGQLGNALKCVWAAPFVANGCTAACVTVEAGDRRHAARVTADEITGEPHVDPGLSTGLPVRNGTSVTVGWPVEASYGAPSGGHDFYRRAVPSLVRAFAALNPHARFELSGTAGDLEVAPTGPAWRKWMPDMRPPPHWYDLARFKSLVAGKLAAARKAGARPPTVRDFIAQNFGGLTGTVVRGELLRGCGLDGATLGTLAPDGRLDDELLAKLLGAMKANARRVAPKKLGVIGRQHLTAALVNLFGADPAFYQMAMWHLPQQRPGD